MSSDLGPDDTQTHNDQSYDGYPSNEGLLSLQTPHNFTMGATTPSATLLSPQGPNENAPSGIISVPAPSIHDLSSPVRCPSPDMTSDSRRRRNQHTQSSIRQPLSLGIPSMQPTMCASPNVDDLQGMANYRSALRDSSHNNVNRSESPRRIRQFLNSMESINTSMESITISDSLDPMNRSSHNVPTVPTFAAGPSSSSTTSSSSTSSSSSSSSTNPNSSNDIQWQLQFQRQSHHTSRSGHQAANNNNNKGNQNISHNSNSMAHPFASTDSVGSYFPSPATSLNLNEYDSQQLAMMSYNDPQLQARLPIPSEMAYPPSTSSSTSLSGHNPLHSHAHHHLGESTEGLPMPMQAMVQMPDNHNNSSHAGVFSVPILPPTEFRPAPLISSIQYTDDDDDEDDSMDDSMGDGDDEDTETIQGQGQGQGISGGAEAGGPGSRAQAMDKLLSSTQTPPKPKPKKKKKKRRRTEGCNCKKSRCLKMYCECYAKQGFCHSKCKCVNCHNLDKPEFAAIRADAIKATLARNTKAFDHIDKAKNNQPVIKTCSCKRSGCNKNYCECYQAGHGCHAKCKCQNCKNPHPKPSGALYIAAELAEREGIRAQMLGESSPFRQISSARSTALPGVHAHLQHQVSAQRHVAAVLARKLEPMDPHAGEGGNMDRGMPVVAGTLMSPMTPGVQLGLDFGSLNDVQQLNDFSVGMVNADTGAPVNTMLNPSLTPAGMHSNRLFNAEHKKNGGSPGLQQQQQQQQGSNDMKTNMYMNNNMMQINPNNQVPRSFMNQFPSKSVNLSIPAHLNSLASPFGFPSPQVEQDNYGPPQAK